MKASVPSPGSAAGAIDTRSLIAALAAKRPSLAGVWLDDPAVPESRPASFRFSYNEVPFAAQVERRDGRVMLALTGAFGVLPFTIESARRRRRLGRVLGAARRSSGLCWEISARQEILVTSETELAAPPSPLAAVTGAVSLILKSRPYIELLVAVASED